MNMTPRPIHIDGNLAFVPLTQGYTAVIDAKDVPLVEGRNWCAHVDLRSDGSVRNVYARSNVRDGAGGPRTISMHRLILGLCGLARGDHKDGNGLNNRRSNLRPATQAQNTHNQRVAAHNRSGVKGVYWFKSRNKWKAQIGVNGAKRHLGYFASIDDAAAAYAAASAKYHGEFGRVA